MGALPRFAVRFPGEAPSMLQWPSDFPSRRFPPAARELSYSRSSDSIPFLTLWLSPKKATRRFPETLCACLRARTRLFLENSVESLPKRDQYLRDELRKKSLLVARVLAGKNSAIQNS